MKVDLRSIFALVKFRKLHPFQLLDFLLPDDGKFFKFAIEPVKSQRAKSTIFKCKKVLSC